jgi:hypothetical protein
MIQRQSSLNISNTLDMLHLISLGMHPADQTNHTTNSAIENNNHTNRIKPRECVEITTDMDSATMINKNTSVNDFSTSLMSGDEELLLFCIMQTDGAVHQYNVINLPLHKSNHQKQKNDTKKNYKFLLREKLLSISHKRILPSLSTCTTTHLSLMKGSGHMEESNKKNQNERRPQSPPLHLNLVDTSIEQTSSSRRTYTNESTCCVATTGYLFIDGCSKR